MPVRLLKNTRKRANELPNETNTEKKLINEGDSEKIKQKTHQVVSNSSKTQ